MLGFWVTAALVFLADHAVKFFAESALKLGEVRVAVAGVLEWRLTHNRGMALGLLSGHTAAILVLPVAAVLLGFLVFRRYQATGFTRTAAALIAGGFAGNFMDRLLNGYVVDMIYFPWMPWYVCNVADVAICVGVALLAVSLLFRPGDWRERKKETKDDAKDDPARGA